MNIIERARRPSPSASIGLPLLVLTLVFSGCAQLDGRDGDGSTAGGAAATVVAAPPARETSGRISSAPLEEEAVPLVEIFPGTGRFINPPGAGAGIQATADGSLLLNFDNTPIAEVVQAILGDLLQANYLISDGVSGTISMRSTDAINRDALIPILDNLLRMNGAALVQTRDFYEVVPIDDGVLSRLAPTSTLGTTRGYQLLVVPLQFVGANEMNSILEPLKSAQTRVVVDAYRNLLMLAGTQSELVNLLETISLFDINQLQGKSVGLYRLQHVEAAELVAELESVFGIEADGPLAGLVSITVIERLNALLVVTGQEQYLANASEWIERLDQAQNPQGMSMFVYYVQNGKAENIAELLTQMFDGQRRLAVASQQARSLATPADSADDGSQARANVRVSSIETGDVSIIADSENNALLIMATPGDYEEVEKAIQQLDTLPMQVLVQASIYEVTLGGELQYGLQWFFNESRGRFDSRGGLGIPASGNIGEGGLPGALANPVDFTYAIFDAAGTRAVLNASAGDSRMNVLSSPSVLVLDNQTATIRVGDQVPIRTSETEFLASTTGNITSRIEYRDTGVTLEITPRVNTGGMVIMEISLHVDDVDETTSSTIDSPTILQREVSTSVAIQSGESIVLGGLIRQGDEQSSGGVPFLKDIPVAGALFGGNRRVRDKTELVVLITPSAIANSAEAQDVTREYRSKLQNIDFSGLR